jgi:hypothetical protein
MFGSSLPPVVGRRVRVLCTLFVFVCAEWCVQQHTGLCFYFVCLRPVLFTQCCQILYIVHSWLPLWYSLAYIYFFYIDLSLYIDTRFASLLCKYTFIFVCFLWCLTSFSTIFQLYHGGQFYWWRKPEDPEKTTDISSHNVVHLALIAIQTQNNSGDRHWVAFSNAMCLVENKLISFA